MSNILAVTHGLLETISDFLLILYTIMMKRVVENITNIYYLFCAKLPICLTFPVNYHETKEFMVYSISVVSILPIVYFVMQPKNTTKTKYAIVSENIETTFTSTVIFSALHIKTIIIPIKAVRQSIARPYKKNPIANDTKITKHKQT